MRLNKLQAVSITCVCLALFLLLNQYVSRQPHCEVVYLIITLCLITSALEIIRLELRDLRRISDEKKQDDTLKQP